MTTNGLKKRIENWNQVNWRKVNKAVRNLRQRIFRARKLGDFRKLRSLQKLMIRSYANLLLSVRRITQTNQGKATAGIDREVINTPEQRVILVNNWGGEKRHQKYGKSYWERNSRNYKIAQNQNWKCPICGESLFNGEELDTHHIVPVAQGGDNSVKNLQHLHARVPYTGTFKIQVYRLK
ncbi:reverse transcriptase N-terminal domain-containing protein [Microcoleus anatoxicus]|uniref:Reverse transcriptase N-terminal domain-containing protein n=1 Tax=Microcoleus anatoxicus PTRS2 TaxID=2705321 RepID=A0ABU8YV43_9CYAN